MSDATTEPTLAVHLTEAEIRYSERMRVVAWLEEVIPLYEKLDAAAGGNTTYGVAAYVTRAHAKDLLKWNGKLTTPEGKELADKQLDQVLAQAKVILGDTDPSKGTVN